MAQKGDFAATGGKTQLRLSENGFHKKYFIWPFPLLICFALTFNTLAAFLNKFLVDILLVNGIVNTSLPVLVVKGSCPSGYLFGE